MPSPDKDDLWAQFQEKTGASRHAVTPRAVVILVAVLLVCAVLAFR
jgi:hypothetical protein